MLLYIILEFKKNNLEAAPLWMNKVVVANHFISFSMFRQKLDKTIHFL